MSEAPLTYTRFIECLDKCTVSTGIRPKCVSMNKTALTMLLNTIPLSPRPSFPKDNERVRVVGVDIEIDGVLPDHVMRIHAPVEKCEWSLEDTHFAGFAGLVLDDLMKTEAFDIVDTERFWGGTLKAEVRQVIARWASRLVLHTILNIKHIDLDRELPGDHVLLIPDITAWPEEDETLAKITRDAQRVMEDKPASTIIEEIVHRYGFESKDEEQ